MSKNKKNDQVVSRTFMQEVWRNYKKSFGAMLGLVVIALVLIIAIWGQFHYDFDADIAAQDIANAKLAPSKEHLFGTDNFGRDILARVIYGAKYSLSVAGASVVVSTTIGVTLGAIAGYYGGLAETIIMRLTDIFASIPSLLTGICIVSAFGQNIVILIIAVAIGGIPGMTRITRASVLVEGGKEYIEAAKATGVNDFKIITTHVLPNALSPILVQCTLRVGSAIIAIASLSFLGLGVQVPAPEWGAMLSGGRSFIRGYGYMTLFPGLAIMIVVLAFNLIGDGLRDSMDPKMKR